MARVVELPKERITQRELEMLEGVLETGTCGSGWRGSGAAFEGGTEARAVMTDWGGDRELAKQRFRESVALAEQRLPAKDLNFFAWRILFQLDSEDVSGLQAALKASLEAERRKGRLEVVRG